MPKAIPRYRSNGRFMMVYGFGLTTLHKEQVFGLLLKTALVEAHPGWFSICEATMQRELGFPTHQARSSPKPGQRAVAGRQTGSRWLSSLELREFHQRWAIQTINVSNISDTWLAFWSSACFFIETLARAYGCRVHEAMVQLCPWARSNGWSLGSASYLRRDRWL